MSMSKQPEKQQLETMRVDKWLWAARFFKTRSIAKDAIEGGKVHHNNERVKVSKEIRVGMELTIQQGFDRKTVVIKALSVVRGGAPIAQQLYEETEVSVARRELISSQRKLHNLARPDHRPNISDITSFEVYEMDDNKSKALNAALSQIEKQFGKNTVMRLGDNTVQAVEAVSTGSLTLDIALGIGGLPKGRIVEIYGPESSGKTTMTLQAIAQCQKAGGTCAFIDAEHALDPQYARKLGVDIDNLLVSQPDNGEQALEIADMLVRSGAVDMIVVDSVAALTPKAEIEGEMGDSHMGLQARLMSQALRKITGNAKRSNCMVIFINQIRMKIGVMFGSPETTTGGNALKFYASVRLDIRRIGQVKEGDEIVGSETKVKVVKNKMAPPFREALFQIMYGKGVNHLGELVDLAVGQELVQKAGAWYSYQGDKIGQGKNNVIRHLEENPQLAQELDRMIREKLLTTANAAPAEEKEEEPDFLDV
ncbi:unnamed protein product [Oppiella nova]|uniref:Recombinase A n=9 Tax=cellular organisms TaxID=131567 RepID=A0A7R9L7B9_9ACAR|nr:unnamed protein product [Oppiella nova]CAG2156452.1 unnamed protein product [Oppiella nova]